MERKVERASSHIPALDGVRGLAILMVLAYHYIQLNMIQHRDPLSVAVWKSLSLTWSGVDLFFVLSGFLITGIIADKRSEPNFFRAFYVRRSCRILPLYFVLLLAFVASIELFEVPYLLSNPAPIWSYATFTQNIAIAASVEPTANWMGMTWSLAVEEQFYLVVPLLFFLAPKRRLLPLCIAGIVMAVALRYFYPGPHAYVLTPFRADSLLMGGALALLVRKESFLESARSNRRPLLALFFVLLAGAGWMTVKPWGPWAHSYFWLACLYTTFMLIVLTNALPIVNRVLCAKPLVWVGGVSYGVYLLHGVFLGFAHQYLLGKSPALNSTADLTVTCFAAALTFGVAALSLRYFESPFIRLGHRVRYDHPRVSVPTLSVATTIEAGTSSSSSMV